MRRLIATLFAWALLSVNPAFAAITAITGTGNGGAITSVTFSATLTLGLVTTASIPANSLVVVIANNCTTGTTTSFAVSDTHTNSYSAPRALDTSNGAATQIFYSYTGTTINSGDTISVVEVGPTGCLTGQVLAFSGTSATPFDVATGAANSGVTGTITVGPTSALACPGGAAGCEVLVGGMVIHTAGTTTNDANFNSVTTPGAGQNWMAGYWIVGATTARSYAPSTTSTTNYGAQLLAFKAATGGASTTYGGLTTTGAGP